MRLKKYFDKVSLNFCRVSAFLSFLMVSCCRGYPTAIVKGEPIIGPEISNFGHLQPVQLIYQPLVVVQNSLPAKEGANFDGPDPGLNANFIRGEGCAVGRSKDTTGVCRQEIDLNYGPNPFSAIIPPTFKGSLNFYMGFKVGNPRPFSNKRRFPILLNRGVGPHRVRNPHRLSRPVQLSENNNEDDDD